MLLLILRLKRTADEIYPLSVLTSEADFVCVAKTTAAAVFRGVLRLLF